jgi:glutamate 5-kinase
MTIQVSQEEGMRLRRHYLAKAKRVVVKVGSAVLTAENGLDMAVLEELARDIIFLQEGGREVILVSSGAVAAGRRRMGYGIGGDTALREKQALAAVGQTRLMRAYEDVFNGFGHKVAQLLLTHDDLSHRDRFLNARNTIFMLFTWSVLPIVNENDTVSVEELRFGDNDTLGAMISNVIEADMFICLTDVSGLYTGNPHVDPEARQVLTVAKVDNSIREMAGFVYGALGSGGMRSKINAAESVAARGGSSFIGPGRQPGIIRELFGGQQIGTFFLPRPEKMQNRKHWIAYVLRPKGHVVLDAGACQALQKGGKSLLPSGIISVVGKFRVGAPIQCLDENDTVVAVGLTNYAADDLEKIRGCKSSQIKDILGFKDSDEVIHRDNLVLL